MGTLKNNAKVVFLFFIGIVFFIAPIIVLGKFESWYAETHDNLFSKMILTEDFNLVFGLIVIGFFCIVPIKIIENFNSKEDSKDSNIFKYYFIKFKHKQFSLFLIWSLFKNYWKVILIFIGLVALFLFNCWLICVWNFSILFMVIPIWILGIYVIIQIIEKQKNLKNTVITLDHKSYFVKNEIIYSSGCKATFISKNDDETYNIMVSNEKRESIIYTFEIDTLEEIGFIPINKKEP